jgi:hypothetical protein
MRGTLAERFWAKVDRSGECWEWRGATSGDGYGRVWAGDRTRQATHVAWEMVNGPIPDGLWVCHSCDNPPCVRVDHLWLGTISDNAKDRDGKGRRDYSRLIAARRAKTTERQRRHLSEMGRRGGLRQRGKLRSVLAVHVHRGRQCLMLDCGHLRLAPSAPFGRGYTPSAIGDRRECLECVA